MYRDLKLGAAITNSQLTDDGDPSNIIILDKSKITDKEYLQNMMQRHGAKLHPSFYGSQFTGNLAFSAKKDSSTGSRKRSRREFTNDNDDHDDDDDNDDDDDDDDNNNNDNQQPLCSPTPQRINASDASPPLDLVQISPLIPESQSVDNFSIDNNINNNNNNEDCQSPTPPSIIGNTINIDNNYNDNDTENCNYSGSGNGNEGDIDDDQTRELQPVNNRRNTNELAAEQQQQQQQSNNRKTRKRTAPKSKQFYQPSFLTQNIGARFQSSHISHDNIIPDNDYDDDDEITDYDDDDDNNVNANDRYIIRQPPKKKSKRTADYVFKNNRNTNSKRSMWLCSDLSIQTFDSLVLYMFR